MRFYLSLLLAACIGTSIALPSDHNHVLHEQRHSTPAGWERVARLPSEQILPMRIAMKQSSIHELDSLLMAVSLPSSAWYGKHWSHKRIAEKFAPSQSTVRAAQEWLLSAGIKENRVRISQSLGWLNFNATVKEAERLIKAEYHIFKHEITGQFHVACDEYHLPEHMAAHVDFITPTIHFDSKVILPRDSHTTTERHGAGFGPWGRPHKPPKTMPRPKPVGPNLKDCSNNVTPDCLRALYGIPELSHRTKRNPRNSFGIVEYTPQSYYGPDLDLFFSNYSKNQVQKRPTLHSIDGGAILDYPDFGLNLESNLDLQYAMALVNPLNVTLYQVGDFVQTDYTSFNNFLDALDASYCSRDDFTDNNTRPIIDAIYPDPLPGGFKGPRNCGGYTAAKVISTSYSYNERDLSPAYEKRQCDEYAKLGLAGTTFLYCSGDYGVAGSLERCMDPSTGLFNDGTSGLFAPSFPSTCPYVLSVGATQIKPNASVTEPEIACATKISSGGGFSNVFPMPSYQSKAVKSWFKNYPPPYSADRFNNTQRARAYPDVSANGAKYVVALNSRYDYHLYGTSASTPVFGAVLTLINEARLNAGKGPVGFINPTLYANPYLLNDIINGTNPGCGTEGFSASPGWDPVTGLGTPNYPKLLQYFMAH